MKRVNLFIVGAAKSGTSSLWAALGMHSDIITPPDELYKEPSYFTPIANHIGIDKYHQLFAAAGSQRYLLDASTSYLTSPGAAQAIFDYNPDAKIIIVLRHPSARAYSLYCWMVAEGYEWASTFEEALVLEETRVLTPNDKSSMPNYFWNYMYKRSGLYTAQVTRYAKLFGKNLHIVNFHDLIARPIAEVEGILEFIDLQKVSLGLQRENPSYRVYHPRLSFEVRKLQQKLGNRFPSAFSGSKARRDWIVNMCQTRHRPPALDPRTRALLDDFFTRDLERLSDMFGITLGDVDQRNDIIPD